MLRMALGRPLLSSIGFGAILTSIERSTVTTYPVAVKFSWFEEASSHSSRPRLYATKIMDQDNGDAFVATLMSAPPALRIGQVMSMRMRNT